MRVFNFSIVYLMALFAFLLVDHYLPRPAPERAAIMQFQPMQTLSKPAPDTGPR